MQPGQAVPLVFLAGHPVRLGSLAHLARLVLLVLGAASRKEALGHGSNLAGLEALGACHIARGTVDPMAVVDTRQEHLVALDPVDGHSSDPNRKDLVHADSSQALEAALEDNPCGVAELASHLVGHRELDHQTEEVDRCHEAGCCQPRHCLAVFRPEASLRQHPESPGWLVLDRLLSHLRWPLAQVGPVAE